MSVGAITRSAGPRVLAALLLLLPILLALAARLSPSRRLEAVLAGMLLASLAPAWGLIAAWLVRLVRRHRTPGLDPQWLVAGAPLVFAIGAVPIVAGLVPAQWSLGYVLVPAVAGGLVLAGLVRPARRAPDRETVGPQISARDVGACLALAGVGLLIAGGIRFSASLIPYRGTPIEMGVITDAAGFATGTASWWVDPLTPEMPFDGHPATLELAVATAANAADVSTGFVAWGAPFGLLALAGSVGYAAGRRMRISFPLSVALGLATIGVWGASRALGGPGAAPLFIAAPFVALAAVEAYARRREGRQRRLQLPIAVAAAVIQPLAGLLALVAGVAGDTLARAQVSARGSIARPAVGRPSLSLPSFDVGLVLVQGALTPAAVRAVTLLAPLGLVVLSWLSPIGRLDGVAAAALSVVAPLSLGFGIVAVASRYVARRSLRPDVVSLGLGAAIGVIVLLLISALTATLGRFSVSLVGLVTVAIPAVSLGALIVAGRLRPLGADPPSETPYDVRDALWIGAAALFGLVLAIWYRWDSPPPFHPAWDAFAHLRIIDGMMDGRFSLLASDYSATFRVNAYLPTQQLTVAIASQLTAVEPLTVYWGGTYVVMAGFAALCFTIGRSIGLPRGASLIGGCAAVIGTFPFQGISFMGLAPAALAALAYPVQLVLATRRKPGIAGRLAIATVIGVGAAAMHFFVGGGALVFGWIAVLAAANLRPVPRAWRIAVAATLVIVALGALSYANVLRFPTRDLAVVDEAEYQLTRITSLAVRERDFTLRMSPLLFVATGLGAVGLLRDSDPRRRALGLMWGATVAVVFLPIAGADRAIAVAPAVIAPTAAYAVDRALRLGMGAVDATRDRALATGFALACGLAIAFLPVVRQVQFQEGQSTIGPYLSSFLPAEREAATTLREQTPSDTVILSDPVSQEIFGGLGDRESYGGGPFASDLQLASLYTALTASTPAEQWAGIKNVAGTASGSAVPVIVVTGRTAAWLENPAVRWIGWPRHLEAGLTEDGITAGVLNNLLDETYYQPIWSSPEVRIVAVRPEPGAAIPGVPHAPIRGYPHMSLNVQRSPT